ncbi:MAG: cyclopropane-fatty-acyl-phospholipid synthase [Lentimonas sp.]|jgi:cyclopropane-fatty-acyl-phospholipid synthase
MDTPAAALPSEVSSKPRLKFLERLLVRFIGNLRFGCLRIQFSEERVVVVGDSALAAQNLTIEDPRFFKCVFSGGSVGFGDAYVNGFWSTSDLSGLLLLLAENKAKTGRLHKGFSFLARFYNRVHHLARSNTLVQSKQNIQAHYDLSNDFYKSFLDPTMTYSSALFLEETDSLEQAQINKIDRMLDLAGVKAGDSILEIGTGWGALALRAAQRGCHVKTITLSEEQYAFAENQFEGAGVAEQIELCLQDYRTQKGQFDAVLSCEMIEAVGKEYLGEYFRIVKQSLKPGAKAVIQAITIADDRYEQYSRGCDWIQKHIFPGGHLPSVGAIQTHVDKLGELTVSNVDAFGKDYAETLRRWAGRFNANESQIQQLGFDEAFCRRWNYYLSYCEAGFDADLIDVNHVVIKRD